MVTYIDEYKGRFGVTGQSRPLFTVSGRWFSLPGFPVNRELGK